MAKLPFLSRSKGGPEPAAAVQAPYPAQAGQVPQDPSAQLRRPLPGQLRREKRALVRAREERIRDLGGLLLEMYKRENFREDLYLAQCREILGLEQRIRELDESLMTVTRTTLAEANRCTCGAPLVWGAHFCANCGRAVGETPVVACAHCGAPLPAEASYCASCGNPAEAAQPETLAQHASDAQAAQEQTIEAPAQAPDPWTG